jgi:hypothetical protein
MRGDLRLTFVLGLAAVFIGIPVAATERRRAA